MQVGARCTDKTTTKFTVWAPDADKVAVHLVEPNDRVVPLVPTEYGYWEASVDSCGHGARYLLKRDTNDERPDPASHWQPDGVHKPSAVVDHTAFEWHDSNWRGLPLEQMVKYELHVGTFTPDGTFDAVIGRLQQLQELGVNTLQIMPVAAFPGARNWGYDGVYPYAVQDSYGGPDGLKRLVDAAHRQGMAVVLDVVYNHLGPEGNYLHEFAPYFTDKYRTPWGWAVNFDDAGSDEVRNYFIENTLYWLRDYHIDGLRLDAVHGIFDNSAHPFLQQLAEAVDDFSSHDTWKRYLIAESDLNDSRIIRPRGRNGYGIHSQWADDFHHSLHTLLTGEVDGYYRDFGRIDDLTTALKEGYVYSGRFSQHRNRSHGNSAADLPGEQFVISTQTHDQVGNRMKGERLTSLVSFDALKVAAGMMLTAPAIPMLFMGEEYGEPSPFLYFISHGDSDLVEAVRKGRKEEFASFGWAEDPPDPQSEETFKQSTLNWELRDKDHHKQLLELYSELLRLRSETPALADLSKEKMTVWGDEKKRIMTMLRQSGESSVWVAASFSNKKQSLDADLPEGQWEKCIDTTEERWGGAGTSLPQSITRGEELSVAPLSFVLYQRNM